MVVEATSRLEARLPASVYATLKRAAELQGRSVSDFVVSAAHEAARRAIEEEGILRLSAEDQQRFAEALLDPPGPGPAQAHGPSPPGASRGSVTRFVSEPLAEHDRSTFTSGNDRIDAYFRQVVSQDVKRKYALCYVLVERGSAKVAGFYTLSSHAIPLTEIAEDIARKLPRYPSVPAALIGWLGRSLEFRGEGIGTLLLADAIHRLVHSPVGVHAICADAIDEAAVAFYRAHQFRSFSSRPQSLYLPMKTAAALFPAARKGTRGDSRLPRG